MESAEQEEQPLNWTFWLKEEGPTRFRCPSTSGMQQCQKFEGHLGLHQESNEVWNHD